ncbi:hypothetical protein M6B38_340940 [Iris pallida]|uniref:Uncharacterized protein n=1 Tax=Iris pallida TaxID=29817 RepID=A0AAX6E726_IRIPA|nr:hypothetical protein M6B38_205940 [Iris pallida]KAJ6833132.1 hypothetical protein M6B38_340940 [Iris pallida]
MATVMTDPLATRRSLFEFVRSGLGLLFDFFIKNSSSRPIHLLGIRHRLIASTRGLLESQLLDSISTSNSRYLITVNRWKFKISCPDP